MYILKSKGQDEGVEVIVQRWEMTKTAVAPQKIAHEPRALEAVWAVAVFVAHAGEIWGKPVRLQIGSTYTWKCTMGLGC